MRLLEPLDIKNMHLNNRLVMLATHLNMCQNGEVSPQLISFYRERACHKPGLIIVGGCYTEHLGMSLPTMIGLSEDRHEPGLRQLTDAIHEFDVPVAAQLYHAGRYCYSFVIGEQAVSASAVPCKFTRETPRAMTLDEIRMTIENFGKAAKRAQRCGFDAVEIIGSAGYLINQFMAPATNKRDDEYGGALENRARFALEVVKEVRAVVDDDYPILYRISGADYVPDGMTLDDNKHVVPWLVDAGVDVLNVTGGWHETNVPQITMDVPRGHYARLAEGLAEVIDIPVIACNRINSPTLAEKILNRGRVQLIGMSRGFIADEAIMDKIRSGRFQEIRPCIACNQGCLDHVFMMEPVTCALNPRAGNEDSRVIQKDGHGDIAVIGAGPAGMEVSRVLALRGFSVTLFEKEPLPGGLLRLAARVPGRGEFVAYVTYMWNELKRLGVDIRLNTHVKPETFDAKPFGFVVCANGTIPQFPPIQGLERPNVLSARDVLRNRSTNTGRVTVIGAGLVGCHVALYLSRHSELVTLVESGSRPGDDIGKSTRWVILKMLRERGVQILTDCEIDQISSNYAFVRDSDSSRLIQTDTFVVATRPAGDERFCEELSRRSVHVERVGSLAGKFDLVDIIHDAFDFANTVSLD